MSRPAEVTLDSYRLAQYAEQVACYVCGEGNAFDTEHCRYCCAPLALAHQTKNQKNRPLLIAAIGASGVGKTVYLGMLMDMLSRRTGKLQLLTRGAFSVSLQQTTLSSLSRCEFPAKTANEPDTWNWVHGQVRAPDLRREPELVLADMAGDALLEEVNHPFSYRVIRAMLAKCQGVLILVDAPRIEHGHGDQDFFTMKLLSYLSELEADSKHGWRHRPVAVVFSKADQCADGVENPSQFARERSGGLWKQCRERFTKHKFFAASVVGAVAAKDEPGVGLVQIPIRVEPRGVVEPFEWIVRSLTK
jgi:hypothetical protein